MARMKNSRVIKSESEPAAQSAAPVVLSESFYTSAYKLRITSTHDGFRRGGRAWSKTPTVVMSEEFTAVQLAQIKAEPRLTVEIIGSDGDPA